LFFVKFITEAKDFCVFFDVSYKNTNYGLYFIYNNNNYNLDVLSNNTFYEVLSTLSKNDIRKEKLEDILK